MPEGTAVADDKLELRYIPLDQAVLWDENPKRHDIGTLIRSIELHGFGDPPKYDEKLGGLVYGNGRTEALTRMQAEEMDTPRGVVKLDDGNWAVPVIFGVDAKSKDAAVAFAIDHNNLTLQGGDLGFTDLLRIWDEEGLQQVLSGLPDANQLLASFDVTDLDALIGSPDFEPVDAADQSRLDEKKSGCCPECGHEFAP